MNKTKLISTILIILIFWGACGKEEEIIFIEAPVCNLYHYEPPAPTRCGIQHKVACSFEFRKGTWYELQDSMTALFEIADTLEFRSDTLIRFTNNVRDILYYGYYFGGNNLIRRRNGVEIHPIYSDYDPITRLFRLDWGFGLDAKWYRKLQ